MITEDQLHIVLETGLEGGPAHIPSDQKGWSLDENDKEKLSINTARTTARERRIILNQVERIQRMASNLPTPEAVTAFTRMSVSMLFETLEIERERAVAQIKEEKMRQTAVNRTIEASIDPLTGLYSRRKIFDILTRNILQALEHEQDLSVLLLDIDKFKEKNDQLGHDVGDEILQTVADTIIKHVRPTDTVAHARSGRNKPNEALIAETRRSFDTSKMPNASQAPGRIGGEELLVVTFGANGKQALQAGNRLRKEIGNLDPFDNGKEAAEKISLPTTVSIGIGALTTQQKRELKREKANIESDPNITDKKDAIEKYIQEKIIPVLLKQADQGLYYSKNNGRNMTVLKTGEKQYQTLSD